MPDVSDLEDIDRHVFGGRNLYVACTILSSLVDFRANGLNVRVLHFLG